MNRALVDDDFRSKLDKFRSQTELCDAEGRLIGIFIPIDDREPQMYDGTQLKISEEELDRRCNEPGEKTTAEVLQALREP